jgi:hypothetical protein
MSATISPVSLESLLAAVIEPHPELVAAMRPTPRQMVEAAGELGFYPADEDRPYWPFLRSWVARGGV